MTMSERLDVASNWPRFNNYFSLEKAESVIVLTERLSTPKKSQEKCLSEFIKRANNYFRASRLDLNFYIIIRNTVWFTESRLTRYYGIYKYFERQGVVLPAGARWPESRVENADRKVRYCGMIKIEKNEFDKIINIKATEASTQIVLADAMLSPDILYRKSIEIVAGKASMFEFFELPIVQIETFGNFDDEEGGIIVFGNQLFLGQFLERSI